MRWDAVAAIAQALEAIVVLIGVPVIWWQLQRIQREEKNDRWDALQWALSVAGPHQIDEAIHEIFTGKALLRHNGPTYAPAEYDIHSLLDNLFLICAAINDGYLDKTLYFRAVAPYLHRFSRQEQPNLFTFDSLEVEHDAQGNLVQKLRYHNPAGVANLRFELAQYPAVLRLADEAQQWWRANREDAPSHTDLPRELIETVVIDRQDLKVYTEKDFEGFD